MSIDLDKTIKSALKSGKVFFGSKQTINAAKTGKAVAIVQALNCPEKTKTTIQSYIAVSKIPLFTYPGSANDLGLLCGKPFMVSAMTIRTLTDPTLLRTIKESTGDGDQIKDNEIS